MSIGEWAKARHRPLEAFVGMVAIGGGVAWEVSAGWAIVLVGMLLLIDVAAERRAR